MNVPTIVEIETSQVLDSLNFYNTKTVGILDFCVCGDTGSRLQITTASPKSSALLYSARCLFIWDLFLLNKSMNNNQFNALYFTAQRHFHQKQIVLKFHGREGVLVTNTTKTAAYLVYSC
jgi:hypothetical protein